MPGRDENIAFADLKFLVLRIFDFLKPSTIKLFFVVEWVLLILFEGVSGELKSSSLLVACLPLAFFYLLASILSALSRQAQHLARGIWLHVIAVGLVSSDQLFKTLVNLTLPNQASLPILKGWLHIANERNLRGSWLLETLDVRLVSTTMLVIFILLFLFGTLIGFGYYTARHRKSVWADVAYLGLFAGLLSAFFDLILRGYTLDYLQVPAIVTADLKDVLITIGIAAFFAEAYDNPAISLRWKGWHRENQAYRQLVKDLSQYTMQQVMRLWAALLSRGKE